MFTVGEGREVRRNKIAAIAVQDISLGVLMAAADFEWTARRAIRAAGNAPTRKMNLEIFQERAFGLELRKGWDKLVRGKSTVKGISDFKGIFDVWARKNCKAYVIWADIEFAMKWRNRLIHGIDGGIGDSEGRVCVNILECASDVLCSYIRKLKKEVYGYIGRPGAIGVNAQRIAQSQKKLADDICIKRERSKDEVIVSGVRIKKTMVKKDLGIKGSDLENCALQLRRKYEIRLLS